jgi:hypothetical protein
MMMDVPNPNPQEQKLESSIKEEDGRSREEMELNHNLQIPSPPKGKDVPEIMMHDAEALKDMKIPVVHNEPESTMKIYDHHASAYGASPTEPPTMCRIDASLHN